MGNTLKRLLSLAVALLMVLTLVPVNGLQVYAANTQEFEDFSVSSNAAIESEEDVSVNFGDSDEVSYVAKIGNTNYESLQDALDAAVAGTGNVTVEILQSMDLTNVDWKPVTVSGPGYPLVTVNGNKKTIVGLNDMLFAGTWAGKSGLIINDLTIKDSEIVNDKDDAKGTVGVGAFIGYPQASATITLNNCHLVNSTVEGGHWTGGLIGMAGGYNGNDGPVFMDLTITGCSVTDSTIIGKGSAGGVIGHGSCAAWTNVVIKDTKVSGNTITSTGSSTNKAGSVMGTIGAAGQPTTAAGETKTGGAFVSAVTSGNTVISNGTAITTIYGRQGTETGLLTVTGGTYDAYPIEENASYAVPKAGYKIVENEDGTFGVALDEGTPDPSGTITYGFTSQTGIWGEGGGNASESFVVELYYGETKIATSQLNNIGGIIDGDVYVTWQMPFAGSTDEYWTVQWAEGHPNKDAQPTKVVLVVDSTAVAENNVQMNAPDNLNKVVWKDLEYFQVPVAQIGEKQYTDLHEAMVACKAGETVLLIADVDLTGTKWEPVSFKGTFDGQNHTISNLTIDKAGVSSTGFITSLNGTFKNVTFTNPTVTGGENTGVVAGRAGGSAALAENITVNGTIKVETTHSGYARAAVIVGGWAYGNYKNITVDGTNAADSYVKHTGGGDGRYVAGIVGHADDVESYVNCTVKNITISGGWLCGAIAGPGPSDGLASGCAVENVNMNADYSGGMFGWYYGNGTIENSSIKNVAFTAGTAKNGAIGGYSANAEATVSNVTIENVTNGGKALLEHVAEIDGTYYFDLQAALDAAVEGNTVKVLADIELTEGITVVAEKKLTLDLAGKTISQTKAQTAGYQMILNDGNLTIDDSVGGGKISYTDSGNGGEYISDAIYNRGVLVINGGTIENLSSATVASNGYPHAVDNYSGIRDTSLTVNGGTIYCAEYSAIRMFCVSATNKADLVINGGTIKGAVDMQNGSKVAALGTLTVNGGTFETTKNINNIRFANWNGGATEYGITASIKGGSFNGGITTAYVPVVANWNSKIISGGTFTQDLSAYCALGYVFSENGDGTYGVINDPKTEYISTLDELKAFRDSVNAGNTYKGITVYLADDIDLGSEEWTPIGNSTNKFQGIFDGQNHTISNLVVNGGSGSNQGFFGFTTDGEIKNLTIENAKVSGRLNVGVVAGTPYTSKYTNIKVTGHVEVEGMAYVGGVGGKNAYANWTDITVDVDETSYVKAVSTENGIAYRTYVGGVVGFNGEGSHTFKNITSNIDVIGDVCDIGGIFGIAHYGNKVENVSCSGDVTSTGEADELGGIAGVWHNQQGYVVTMNNVTFTGTVSDMNGAVEGVAIVGGAYNAAKETAETSGSLLIDGKEAWLLPVKIGQTKYESLEAAINAAQDGDTITLLQDVEVTESLVLNTEAAITIDGAGHTIKPAAGYTDTQNALLMLGATTDTDDAAAKRNYTIKNVVFDGAAEWSVIRSQGVTLTVDNCTVQNCQQKNGQALLRLDYTNAIVKNTTIKNNNVLMAITHNFNGDSSNLPLTVDNCVIEGNVFNKTAAIYYVTGSGCEIKNSEFIGNTVNCSNNGAMIYLGFQDNCTVTGNLFKNNKVTDSSSSVRVAGAIFAGYQATITGNAFDGNTATNTAGDTLGQVCISTYYDEGLIDLSGNYWNGEAPVLGKDVTIIHQTGGADYGLTDYYTAYSLDSEGNVVLSDKVENTYVAQIVGSTVKYTSLAEAFTAAKADDEVKILAAGTYALTTSGKDITITGAVDGVVFANIGKKNLGGANVTFNYVTFNYAENSSYMGLQHSGDLVYNDCTFNGQVFLYGQSETFNKCTFNTTDANNYNVWTYSAKKVAFNECSFNCAGKSVLVYNEGAGATDLTVTDTTFTASQPVDGKAAIEIDTTAMPDGTDIVINDSTATGFATGSVSGNSLWNDKKDQTDLTVTVDGTKVWPVSADMTYSAYGFSVSGEGEKYRERFGIDLYRIVANESLTLELYDAEGTLLAVVSRRATDRDDESVKLFPVSADSTTVNIVVAGRLAGSWDTEWKVAPSVAHIPATVKVYADGKLVDTYENAFEAVDIAEYAALPGVEKAAKIGDTYYATLQAAVNAAVEGDTITILAGIVSEGTVKLPATMKNVTFKGEEGAILKDTTIIASDGNSISYEGLNFDGITFENSRISITGWRTGGATVKDLTVTNCTFKNLDDTTNSAPVHINMDAKEAVENFTFTNNVIDGATGGSKSGVYAQTTGKTVFTGNTINNVSFRPYVIQITTDDGIADEFIVTGNTFSGSAAGRAQGLGNNAEGNDTVKLVVSENIFKGITSAQQICYWNFNEETTTADLSKNYYDIDILNNPSKIYYNSAAQDVEDLIEMGVFPYYADEAKTELVEAPAIMVTYADGTIEYFEDMREAVPHTTNYPKLEGATVTLLRDMSGLGMRFMENGMVFDLNGYTYTLTGGTGSKGTETSAFQIRPEVTETATIKNGTIQLAEGVNICWIFNNYATNFVVEDVTVDCANMAYSYGQSCYVAVSRAEDNVQLTGNTQIINFNSQVAGNAYSIGGTMTMEETVVPGGSFELDVGATLTAPAGLDVAAPEGYKVVYENGTYSVKIGLPEVKVTDIKGTLTGEDPDLTFALNFAIPNVEDLSEEYLNKLFEAYGNYYVDYVLTINGLNGDTVTFNANGDADGYLAGQYDAWSENWVTVPFSDVVVNDGESLYIMEYAAKLMGKTGLRFTLAEVATIVQNFDCGVYLTPEFLAEHPDLEISLVLKVFTEDAEGNKIENIDVATNKFKNSYAAAVSGEGKQTVYYATFAEAYAAAQEGDTVELLKDAKLSGKLTVAKSITIDGNGCSIIANHTAFILETSADCTFKDVTLDTNNKAKGVKIASGNVVFDNVTIPNSNKSDAITVLGSLLLKNYFNVATTYTLIDARSGSVTAEPGTVFDIANWRANVSPAKNDLTGVVDTEGNPFFDGYSNTTYIKDLNSSNSISGVTLLDDVTLTKDMSAAGTLNLNGHDLIVADDKTLKVSGNLTITGEGNFDGTIKLIAQAATLTAPAGMENVMSGVEGYVVIYNDGMYMLVKENTVAWNVQTREQYETVAAALNAAAYGQTVQMLTDSNEATSILLILNGITLDLNGKQLTALYAITTASEAGIIDSTDAQGILKVAKNNLTIQSNAQLPVWIQEDAGFRFAVVLPQQRVRTEGTDKAYYTFYIDRLNSSPVFAKELADGSEDGDGLSVTVKMYYTDRDGQEQTLNFAPPADVLMRNANTWYNTELQLTGIRMTAFGMDTVTNVSFQTVYAYGNTQIVSERIPLPQNAD